MKAHEFLSDDEDWFGDKKLTAEVAHQLAMETEQRIVDLQNDGEHVPTEAVDYINDPKWDPYMTDIMKIINDIPQGPMGDFMYELREFVDRLEAFEDGGLEIEEGWKDKIAGAALAGAMALGGGAADAAVKKPVAKPNVVQQVAQKDIAASVTKNPHEVYLRKVAEKSGIKGQELVAFLSQCAHETLDFKHMKEMGGKLDFKKYDPRFAPRKARILGNTQAGDGAKYKGRGYIQLTGRDNYRMAGEALGLPLEQHPEMVEKPEVAAKVAVWYWKTRVAKKVNSFKDTASVTKTINPGLKHLDQRKDKMKSFQVAMR